MIGDDLIENEFIKILELSLPLLERLEIINIEMKHVIFGKMLVKKR